jgi:hypothetical protein
MTPWFLQSHPQTFQPVEPVYPLVIHFPAFPLEKDMKPSVTIAYPRLVQVPQPDPQSSLLIRNTSVLAG